MSGKAAMVVTAQRQALAALQYHMLAAAAVVDLTGGQLVQERQQV
jgi:hypothetical protein